MMEQNEEENEEDSDWNENELKLIEEIPSSTTSQLSNRKLNFK